MPPGAQILSQSPERTVISVSLDADDDGYFGRACPACAREFRTHVDDCDNLPDDTDMFCVYCGHSEDGNEFTTTEQEERAMAAAGIYAEQMIGGQLDRMLGRLASRYSSPGGAVRLTYRVSSALPEQLPEVVEEAIVREWACQSCGIRYAVFGEHVYCPTCGLLPPGQVALDALGNQRVLVNLADALPPEEERRLLEQGVFDRLAADALRFVVAILEGFLGATFRATVLNHEDALRGKGAIFQRLDDMATLFQQHLNVDLVSLVGHERWDRMKVVHAKRHLLVHNNGMIDDRYLSAVPSSALRVGQRLLVTRAEAAAALDDVEQVVRAYSPGT
jgi:hypothetical protein